MEIMVNLCVRSRTQIECFIGGFFNHFSFASLPHIPFICNRWFRSFVVACIKNKLRLDFFVLHLGKNLVFKSLLSLCCEVGYGKYSALNSNGRWLVLFISQIMTNGWKLMKCLFVFAYLENR